MRVTGIITGSSVTWAEAEAVVKGKREKVDRHVAE